MRAFIAAHLRASANSWLVFTAIVLAICVCIVAVAQAQHNHDAGHNDYLGWASGKVANCCNNQDCGVLEADEHREGATGPEVKISGQWCPVRPEHFLTKGRSPDWNMPHACIRKAGSEDDAPCARLLCYSGKGGF